MRLAEVYAARQRISPWVIRTPTIKSVTLSKMTGGEVWLKLENRQLTGSFKVRGALNRMATLSPEDKQCGVVTASSGNHALGIAYAAKTLGIKATIVVSSNAPEVKKEAIKALGSELYIHGAHYMEARNYAAELAKTRNLVFISAYNDLGIIAGQGTVGLEMIEDTPDLEKLIVPVGGGGLISGIATVWKEASDVEVVGAQTKASPAMSESVMAGRVVEVQLSETIAEGLHGGLEKDPITLTICRKLVDSWDTVGEEAIRDAVRFMVIKQHEVVEGAGVVGVAALMQNLDQFRGKRVGVVISGSNIDESRLKQILCGPP
jgi:threonine dehydratase